MKQFAQQQKRNKERQMKNLKGRHKFKDDDPVVEYDYKKLQISE